MDTNKNAFTFIYLRKRRVNTMTYCFEPFYIMSRICGLLPFTLHYDSRGKIKRANVSIFDAIWFIASIGIYLMFAYTLLIKIISFTQMGLTVYLIGMRIVIFAILLNVVLSITFDMLNRNLLVKILKDFINFDNNVS